jgi:predicted dehydrogenase
MRPFRPNVHPVNWRWWYDFGTGDMGNDGVHDIEIARWGLGVETHPNTIAAIGGKYFFDDDRQWPDTQYVVFEYASGDKLGQKRQLIYEQRDWSPYVQEGYENGCAYYGTKGYMLLGKLQGYQIFGPRNKLIEDVSGSWSIVPHHADFLSAIKTGARPHADIEIHHLTAALCHLGNIATRAGRVLHFDPQTEKIAGDEEASRLLSREYREGHWAVPKGV